MAEARIDSITWLLVHVLKSGHSIDDSSTFPWDIIDRMPKQSGSFRRLFCLGIKSVPLIGRMVHHFVIENTSLKSASRRCYFLYIPTTTPRPLSMAGLQCHAIEIKIVINHSVKLGYDRWLIYKPLRHDLDLCGSSFARYSEKCFTPICRALYGDAMLVRFGEGHQHPAPTWRP